ncbi:MAG: YcgL domain-containing protein [Gammaproteobacteria bacterium]|nr:YcgL domain-containing protein [Gammaproteobacteria bacterium]
MDCVVYRSKLKDLTYLYIKKEDDFSQVPDTLINMLGALEQVMFLELHPKKKLAQVEVLDLIHHLKEAGWYLQIPDRNELPKQLLKF